MSKLLLQPRSYPAVFALALAFAVAPLHAQTPAPADDAYVPTMVFDVVSIHESNPSPGGSITVGGRFVNGTSMFRVQNFDMWNLVGWAYNVRGDQIVGLPVGSRSVYTIEAKSDEVTDARLAKLTPKELKLEQQHMIQTLLAERFQLKTHWENRETIVYELVVTKKGPRMSPGGSVPLSEEDQSWKGAMPPIYQRGNGRGYTFVAHQCSMGMLANTLSGQFGHRVLDRTGLEGKYDFTLQYHGTFQSDRSPDDLDPVPTLDKALQDELGLKLQTTKGQDKFLIVDHIEKPSAN